MAALLLAAAFLIPAAAPSTAGSVPHEQFDKAQLDLAILKLLLNESLRLATESILSCVADDSAGALTYSADLQKSIEAPAGLIESLAKQVGSYSFLAFFVPPFQNLSVDDGAVTSTYSLFLQDLTALRSIAQQEAVPVDAYENAMALLSTVNSYIYTLLHELDVLESDANEIAALPPIPEQTAFDVSDLLAAINALRNKLLEVETELVLIAEKIMNPVPRLFLMVSSGSLHLGETLILTGYLLFAGQFVKDQDIVIYRDGAVFTTVNTGQSGKFALNHYIPIDPAELGVDVFGARTQFNSTWYYSDNCTVVVTRIPTVTVLEVASSYRLGDIAVLNGSLRDYRSNGLAGQTMSVALDGAAAEAPVTDARGMFNATIDTASLGFGPHTVTASYAGNATHAPSSTSAIVFVIKCPAVLTLDLSATTVALGDDLGYAGGFTNTSGEPIPGAEIRIVVDGRLLTVLSTGANGSFRGLLDTAPLGPGRHSIFAEHTGAGTVWYYTRSPILYFDVTGGAGGGKHGWLPGIIEPTGRIIGDIGDIVKEIFFGKTAPFAWALLILLLALAYWLYRKAKEKAARRKKRLEEIQRAIAYEPKIVPSVVRPLAKPAPGPRGLKKSTLMDMIESLLGSMGPRDAIILGYARFLQFLGSEKATPIEPNLTHLEIQSELAFMGYPKESLRTITRTYEKAMYTSRDVTAEDALGFADALRDIEGYGKVASA